jgi:hypothetical protein
MNVETRQFGRRTNRIHGWIEVAGRPRLPDILNHSVDGALIEFAKEQLLPFKFALWMYGRKTVCEARHHLSEGKIGVRFVRDVKLVSSRRKTIVTDADKWRG